MIQHSPYRSAVAVALSLAVVLGGVLALSTAVPARAASTDANGATTFSVSAVAGYSFNPSTVENVASGTNVTVTFTDLDVQAHTFTIYGRQGVVIPTSTDPGALVTLVYGSGVKPLVNINLTNGNGQQQAASFPAPPVGWYEYLCMEPGHFNSGMFGFIAFGEALPANLSVSAPSTGPGAAVFIIVGTIVSLVVIAIVLGFVVGRRRGSEDEMPPERLGYPEPTVPEPPPPPSGPMPKG